jgi:hypothetical protein
MALEQAHAIIKEETGAPRVTILVTRDLKGRKGRVIEADPRQMGRAVGNLGNALTALAYWPQEHRSLGASTAVFGALGLLVGDALWLLLRRRAGRSWWKWMLPLGAGLSLLAFLGTGEGKISRVGLPDGGFQNVGEDTWLVAGLATQFEGFCLKTRRFPLSIAFPGHSGVFARAFSVFVDELGVEDAIALVDGGQGEKCRL